jgi:hypothetical protein
MLATILKHGGPYKVENNITANAAGTKGAAYVLTAAISRLVTVAASASALLPPALAGLAIAVINRGANTANLFAAGTDQIDGASAATAKTLATGKTIMFFCAVDGQWDSLLGA